MNKPDVKKKQLAQLWELAWIPEIDAAARKWDMLKEDGKPDRAAAVRFMVRKELDKLGYQTTEADAEWVLSEIRKNKAKRSSKK